MNPQGFPNPQSVTTRYRGPGPVGRLRGAAAGGAQRRGAAEALRAALRAAPRRGRLGSESGGGGVGWWWFLDGFLMGKVPCEL